MYGIIYGGIPSFNLRYGRIKGRLMASGHTEDVIRLFAKRPQFEDLGIEPRRPLKDIRRSVHCLHYSGGVC